MIDLSSDTATRPSVAMRQFMAAAPVGDEQKKEDPSVNRLQEMVARLTGKAAALYLPSGTMCNAIGVKLHTQPGDKIIIERASHIYTAEAGGPGLLSGVMTELIEGERGVFTSQQVEAGLHPRGALNNATTTLMCLENTHNRGGGRVWPLAAFQAVAATARAHGLRIHLDGARLLNAVVASRVPAAVWAAEVDTVWIDLSKGLGAPVGGVLAADQETIERARRYKQMFGGAMRQAGIIAAGGIYALEHNIERLAEDHTHAQLLATGLAGIPGVHLDPAAVETNIVFFDIGETGITAQAFNDQMQAHEVRMAAGGYGPTVLRAVTHLDISQRDVEHVIDLAAKILRS